MSGKLKLRNYSFKLSQSIPDYNSISEDCLQCTKINYQARLLLNQNNSFILHNITSPNVYNHRENKNSNTSIPYEQELNLILSHSKPKKKLPLVPRYPSIPKPLNQQQKSIFPAKLSLPFNNQMIKNALNRSKPIKRTIANITTPILNANNKINLSNVLTKDPSLKCLYTNKMNKRLIQFFQFIYQKPSNGINIKQLSEQQ